MRGLIIAILIALPMGAFAQEHFSYLGVNLGTSMVDSSINEEVDSKTGLYYGGAIGHEMRFKNKFNLNLGLDYNVQEIETILNSNRFEKVFLDSKYMMVSINPTYAVSKSIDVGIKADFAVGNDGILVSQNEGAKELFGVNAFYNIPMNKEKDKLRVGLAIQSGTTDTSYVQAGLTIQYAFGWTKKVAPVVAKRVEPKPEPKAEVKTPVIVRKEITYVNFRDNVVQFGNDSAEISEKSKAFLAELATFLRQHEGEWESVKIIGHTSQAGSEKYNKYLSYKRANAVLTVFKEMGVSPEKISVEGAGESQPLVWPEINEETASQNRRVELRFMRMKEGEKFQKVINLLQDKHKL